MCPRRIQIGLVLAIAVFIPATLVAAPMMINMQGQLTDDVGNPVADGTYLIEFRLFDAASGGMQRWSTGGGVEVYVESGLFNYLLGSDTPLPFYLADFDSLWLEMVPDGQPPMAPRIRLASAMWAIRAAYADTASAAWAVVGGTSKWKVIDTVLFTDRMWGLARGSSGSALYGTRENHINLGVACTTGVDGQNYFYAQVLGGYGNRAGHSLSTVVGGQNNRAMGAGSTITGGTHNNADSDYGTISGGNRDTVAGAFGFIGGGYLNYAGRADADSCTVIGGGGYNSTFGAYTAIVGGWYNEANSPYATVVGGADNTANDLYSFVGAGTGNRSSGYAAVVGGGVNNFTDAAYSAILGGYGDTITVNGTFSCLFGIGSKLTQDSTFMVDMPHIRFGDETTGYEFPSDNGSTGQVLVTDGAGALNWADISGTEPGGWTDDGAVVRLTTTTDSVGIGTANPQARLHVEGNAKFQKNNGRLVLRTTGHNDPGRFGIRFENNSLALVSGDETQEQYFQFMSDFVKTRNYDAHLRVYGSTASSWGTYLEMTHDGTDGLISTDIGDIILNPAANVGVGIAPSQKFEVNGIISSVSGGFKFPDGTQQVTAAGAGNWTLTGDIVSTINKYGITRGGADNYFYGSNANTMTNLGVACTTGVSGFNYSYATVAGGHQNVAAGIGAAVGGGQNNRGYGAQATIAGGFYNSTGSMGATVGGGDQNQASGILTTVSGGIQNVAWGMESMVGGGKADTAYGMFCGIASGYSNCAGSSTDSAAFVGGGYDNAALGSFAVVAGGKSNGAGGDYSVVCGGSGNGAIGDRSFVGSGSTNVTSGSNSAILGGANNLIGEDGVNSMVFGVQVNLNSANRAMFFEGTNSGRIGINRDDIDGGVSYPIHVGTAASSTNGHGAYLTGGGVWTNASSRTFKEDFQPLERDRLLAGIAALTIESWQYKDSDERHIGPVAEDFVAAFDVGAIRTDGTRENQYLSTADVAGVALLGVKELISENQELKQVIEELRREIAALKAK